MRRAPSWWPVVAIVFLFLVGCGVLLFPPYSNWLAEYNSTRATQSYFSGVKTLSQKEAQAAWAQAYDYNDRLSRAIINDPFTENVEQIDPFDEYYQVLNIDGVMGIIQIPALALNLPLYHGVSDEVLSKGVGHIKQTALPLGQAGFHSVLTGHSGLPRAKIFTDLTTLKEGDTFRIYVIDKRLSYRIDSIKVVEPADVSSLMPVENEDRVTLVTCTPYGINSHRLLVSGVRFDEPADALPLAPEKEFPWKLVVAPALIVCVAMGSLVYGIRAKSKSCYVADGEGI